MRKFKLFLILAFIFSFIPKGEAEEIEFVNDGIKYRYNPEVSISSCQVIAGDKPYEGDIMIPGNVTYEGIQLTVNRIEANAFRDCTKLTSIIISLSIYYIGERAFENCVNLNGIDSRNTLEITHIGDYAFKGCEKITEFHSRVLFLGKYAFQGCKSLEKIRFPNLQIIGEGTFDDCTSLSNIYIPKVKTIYPAFKNSWKGKLVLSKDIKYVNSGGRLVFEDCAVSSLDTGDAYNIPDSMFYNCDNLRDIFISKYTKHLGKRCFAYCDNIENITVEKLSEESILWVCGKNRDYYGFEWSFWKWTEEPPFTLGMCTRPFSNSNVKNITINRMLSGPLFGGILPIDGIPFPKDVKYTYGPEFIAFPPYYLQYAGLKKLEIPESVTGIMAFACANNDFEEIVIPPRINNIGIGAFLDCKNVKKLVFEQSDEPISIYLNSSVNVGIERVSPFAGAVLEYVEINRPISRTAGGQPYYEYLSAFSNLRIKELKFPNGMTALDMGLFLASTIVFIDIPESVDEITIPHQIIHYGDYNGIYNLVVKNPIPPFIKEGGSFSDQINIYVPDSSVEAYKSNDQWGKYNILPLSEFSTKEMDDEWALGIDDIRNEKTYFNYSVDGDVVSISGTDSATYEIYTLSGQLMYRGNDDYQLPAKGIYLLKSGRSAIKIIY